jgi:hypothetical protein
MAERVEDSGPPAMLRIAMRAGRRGNALCEELSLLTSLEKTLAFLEVNIVWPTPDTQKNTHE